jgi:hypothetical protein
MPKDRRSNVKAGSICDSGTVRQSPNSHQEIFGAAIDLPYRPSLLKFGEEVAMDTAYRILGFDRYWRKV